MATEALERTAVPPPGSRLPALVQTLLLYRDPTATFERWRRRYGDVFRVRFLGLGDVAYVAAPGLARRIYAADRDVGRAGDARRPFLEPLVGRNSLLCLEGDAWQRQRRLLSPPFHGDSVTRWRDAIRAIAEREVATWPSGEPIRLRPRMQAITLEIILRIVFGVQDAERLEQLRRLVPELMDAVASPFVSGPPSLRERLERNPLLRRLPGNPVARLLGLRAELDEILYDEIGRRRDALSQEVEREREDVLSLLLAARDEDGHGMEDEELRDELVTLLVAGHETTATALAWSFERLVRHANVLERLRAEVRGDGEEYLDAVVKEVLRTRPVVIDTPRELVGPLELDGYTAPAGWFAAPAIPLVHATPSVFDDAEDFRPERFLAEDPPVEAWIPFGGGRRRCLGSQLALLELRTVIPVVLDRFVPRAADPAPERQRVQHVTMAPSEQARVVLDVAAAS